jgi:Protein of unknown function, DUF481
MRSAGGCHDIRAILVAITALAFAATADAQPKTDVVTLANGDRITGEVKGLDRGRLEFSTDDAGTLYLEWDKLVSVVAKARLVEVVTNDGRRFLGTLGVAPPRSIAVVIPGETAILTMPEVTIIRPIGTSFWSNLDGSVDAGFNYTRSSGVAQLNFNSDTVYRKFASQFRLTASLTVTETDDDEGRDDRGTMEMSYLRYPWREWFVVGAGRFETNESLGVELRSQIGIATGPRVINSNRAQLSVGGGIVFNDELGVDVERTQNVEALLTLQTSYFTYDRPKTNLDLSLQYYPSLSNTGRHRVELDAGVKREFFKDVFVALHVYNSYDNRPPNPAADRNDIGIVASIGWTY